MFDKESAAGHTPLSASPGQQGLETANQLDAGPTTGEAMQILAAMRPKLMPGGEIYITNKLFFCH